MAKRRRSEESNDDEHMDWSHLPEPALLSVSQKLANLVNYYAFAETCRSWRAVAMAALAEFVASHPPLVCFMMDGCLFHGPLENRSYRSKLLGPRLKPTALLINVCHGYLVIDEDRPPNFRKLFKLWLVNPFTGDEVHSVPPGPGMHVFWVVLTAPPRSRDCTVVACIEPSDSYVRCAAGLRAVIYCRPGDRGWRLRRCRKPGGGMFGVASPDGKKVYVWLWSPNVDILVLEFGRGGTDGHPVLVKETVVEVVACPQSVLPTSGVTFGWWQILAMTSDGELLLVELTGFVSSKEDFDAGGTVAVHRLDLPGRRCVRMESLGGRALLLATKKCVVLDDPGRWGIKKDHVYFVTGSSLKVFPFFGDGDQIPASSVTSVPLSRQHQEGYKASFWVLPSLCV